MNKYFYSYLYNQNFILNNINIAIYKLKNYILIILKNIIFNFIK